MDFICFQQNETSSATVYKKQHIKSIVKAARKQNPNTLIIMDAVSGTFAHDIKFDDLDIDVQIIGSQKGLGVSSGVTYIVISNRFITKMLWNIEFDGDLKSFKADSSRETLIEKFAKTQQVSSLNLLDLISRPDSDQQIEVRSIFHVLSTAKSLQLMEDEGGRTAVLKRHEDLARLCREIAQDMSLTFFSPEDFRSNSVTALTLDDKVSAVSLKKYLQTYYGIIIAGAQIDRLKESLIRIGTVGFIKKQDIIRCMRSIRIFLHEQD